MKLISTIFLVCVFVLTVSSNSVQIVNGGAALQEKNPLNRTDTIALPFVDEFTSGALTTQGWETGNASWHVNTQNGNILPCAEFQPAGALINYEETLTSPWIDGNSVTDCRIYVDFDLRLTDALMTEKERLRVEIFSDTSWNEVKEYRSTGSTDWDLKHINITVFSRRKFFKLRFKAMGENSNNIVSWQIDNINIRKVCEPPTDAWCTQNDIHEDQVKIEWEEPGYTIPPVWRHWDDGNSVTGIGLTNGGTFDAAIRFTPDQIIQWGSYPLIIQKIKIFPRDIGGPIVLKIWQGEEPPQLIYSQPVNAYNAGEWNIYDIDSIFYIDHNRELWIGYEVTHDAGQLIAGVDDGPCNEGYGDMISYDGITWEPFSSYGMNYNWNIQASIGEIPAEDTCFTIGYNVYRDEEYLATTIETNYIDLLPDNSSHCYIISALYNDGESELSNETCYWVDVDKIDPNEIAVTPNPATSIIYIQLVPGLSKIEIIDLTGRLKDTYKINPLTLQLAIDASNYIPGIYLLRFIGNKTSFEKKLVIQ